MKEKLYRLTKWSNPYTTYNKKCGKKMTMFQYYKELIAQINKDKDRKAVLKIEIVDEKEYIAVYTDINAGESEDDD